MFALPFSRREVLRSGALALAGGVLGCRRSATSVPFDVCIIGSGFAGVYLAMALAESGARIAVIEAGPRLVAADPPAGRAHLLPVESVGDTGFVVDDTRTVGVGGTSRRWSGVLSRLAPADFRAGTLFGGGRTDWPIAYEDLAPYYCRAESAMAVRGGRYAPAAAEPPRECSYPFEMRRYVSPARLFPDRRLEFVPLPMSTRQGTVAPLRLAEEEVPRLAALPGVTLLAERTALAVVEDGDSAAVRVRDTRGATEELRARAVVIAAGVFETARLLLSSRGPRHPAGLGNRSGFLGSHFTVHPADRFEVARGGPRKRPGGVHRTYAFAQRLRREGLGAAHADLHLQPESAMVEMMLETETVSGNRFTVNGEGKAALRFGFTERDQRTIAEAGRIGRGLLRAIAAEGARPAAQGRLWFHPAGLCRMAEDEQGGVVDRDLRVFGTRNVYVAGAAVFPTAGSSNPTLTVVALSMRLADHLLERHSGGSLLGRFGFPTR